MLLEEAAILAEEEEGCAGGKLVSKVRRLRLSSKIASCVLSDVLATASPQV